MAPKLSRPFFVALLIASASCGETPEGPTFLAPARAPLAPLPPGALFVTNEDELLAPDGEPSDLFGYAVALTLDTALAGAPYEDEGGTDAGAAYVFVRKNGGWGFEQKLAASDVAAGKWFGQAVTIAGDTAVVGAPFGDGLIGGSGAAYVFARTNGVWIEVQKLLADDGGPGDLFGQSLAISGGTVVVGAPHEDAKGADAGAAYVFVKSGGAFVFQKKLLPADGAAGDTFGAAISLDGDTTLVGAPADDDLGLGSGSAYVFVRAGTSWSQQKKLAAVSGGAGDGFGAAVSVLGNTAIVGAPSANLMGVDSGAAHAFVRTGLVWTPAGDLVPVGLHAGDKLGQSLALGAKAALVGATQDDTKGGNAGAAYVFSPSAAGFVEDLFLVAKNGSGGDAFGFSTAIAGDTALVGAYLEDEKGTNSGAAIAFVLKNDLGDPCGGADECASGHCVDGVCCDVACAAGECDTCAGGTCTLLEGAACDDGDVCTVGDVCAAGLCKSGAPTGCLMDAGADADASTDADADADADAGADAATDADAAADADADADAAADAATDSAVRLAGGACSMPRTPESPSPLFLLACLALALRRFTSP